MSVADSPGPDADQGLPEYALELASFHRAFQHELREIIDLLPIGRTDRVLDVGCGDGFYTELIGQKLTPPGKVVGLDANATMLELAEKRVREGRGGATVEFRQGTLESLPSEYADQFDVIWCAQSLYSFDEPVAALKLMSSALRPGGVVAVLENDTLHQLLMPWPTTVELALRAAERDAFEAESPRPGKYYVGRRLPATLAAAGLEPAGFSTRPIDRRAPLDPVVELFLKKYLERLRQRTEPFLSAPMAQRLRELVGPAEEDYLPGRPHFTLTWLNVLCWGRKPR